MDNFMSIPALEGEKVQDQPNLDLKSISADLIRKNDFDVRKTIKNFFNEVVVRSKRGESPNADFGIVAQDLSSLLPHYEELERLRIGKGISRSSIYNNLIYDNMSRMNKILYDQVYETPDPITLTPEQELFGVKQALIELQNNLPHIRNKKIREDVLWNINYLNSIIMRGGGM